MTKNIGVVGLGAMGRGMAASLRRAGWNVHVSDVRLDVALDLTVDGSVACASPAALDTHYEVIAVSYINMTLLNTAFMQV